MKKLITLAIVVCIGITVLAQPIDPLIIEPTVVQNIVKIDDQTCEITTITTTESVIRYDRAEVQTELDHIPDRKAEIQKQLDVVNEREAELIEILKVFK